MISTLDSQSVPKTILSLGRFRQQCRRGVLELDVLLERWLDHYFQRASDQTRLQFYRLLQLEDDALQSILCGRRPAPAPYQDLIDEIRKAPEYRN